MGVKLSLEAIQKAGKGSGECEGGMGSVVAQNEVNTTLLPFGRCQQCRR